MLDVFKTILPHLAPPASSDPTTPWWPARKPARACDSALTGTCRHWLRRLPPRRRPLRLCTDYPRVANRIAWTWSDSALTLQLLNDLLTDKRGGRRGFGTAITRELQRLREFNEQQRVEIRPESFWSAVGRVIGAD